MHSSQSTVDSSDDEELTILCNPMAPLPTLSGISQATLEIDTSGTEDFDDDSSLGMGNAYGEFAPLYDLKISIAPHGYIDYYGDGESLSHDEWVQERSYRSVRPLSRLIHGKISGAQANFLESVETSS